MRVHDILAVADTATALLIGVGFLIASLFSSEKPALRWWAGGFVLLAVSMATISLRSPGALLYVQSVCWGAFFGAVLMLIKGISVLEERRIVGLAGFGAAAVLLVAVFGYLEFEGAHPPGWYYLGPVPALGLLVVALVGLRPKQPHNWGVAAGLLIFAGVIVVRSVSFADTFMASHPPHLSGDQTVPGAAMRIGPSPDFRRPPPPRNGRLRPPPPGGMLEPLPGRQARPGMRPPPPPRDGFARPARQLVAERIAPGRPGTRFDAPRPAGALPPAAIPVEQPLAVTLLTIAGLIILAGLLAVRAIVPAMERLKKLSDLDGLTGLLNRRAFDVRADNIVRDNGTQPVCAIVFDIDHFKRINDECGHACGDRAIKRLGEILAEAADERQIAGRIGGEEFAVVLPNCTVEMAQLFAENIRVQLSSTDFGAEIPFKITLSAGLAMRERGERLDQLMRRADKALYEAKNGGRDRVRVAGFELPGAKFARVT